MAKSSWTSAAGPAEFILIILNLCHVPLLFACLLLRTHGLSFHTHICFYLSQCVLLAVYDLFLKCLYSGSCYHGH